jgi:hypothetical protein
VQLTFHPRALLVMAPLVLLLWLATDLRWVMALGAANLVFNILSFTGVFGARRR